MRTVVFPLDEELGLLPGVLTPRLHEQVAQLGAWMPFAPSAQLLRRFTGVTLSAALANEAVTVARLCDELPLVPAGPERGPECGWGDGAAARRRPRRGAGLIGDMDTLIAATALEDSVILVTAESDFTRVPSLTVHVLPPGALDATSPTP